MNAKLGIAAGLLVLAAPSLRAQVGSSSAEPAYMDSVSGDISAMLPSGATLRGAGATVYLWAATPEMRGVLDAACTAAHVRPDSWIAARTEIESPSGFPLDSAATADLSLLRRLIDVPHAVARADSSGHFTFIQVPYGTFWISAEMLQNGNVVQWWHEFALGRVGLQLAKLFRQTPAPTRVDLGTSDFTHDEFCTGGEPAMGAAALAVGQRTHAMSKTATDSAYVDVDQPGAPLDDVRPAYPEAVRKEALEGSVTAEFVIDQTGAVDMRTLRILKSTDFRFTQAVRELLPRKRYKPARIDGHPVRWLTTQDFIFSLNYY